MDLHIFYGASVCRKAKTILKVVYPMMSYIVGSYHTCHNVYKGLNYIEEINKNCIEDNVCLNSVKTEIWGITGELLGGY